MPQATVNVENNFTKGLITEATGLNFPENAATSTENCVYTLIGDVTRRLGFDYESNFATAHFGNTGIGISTYKWNNAGGDGVTQVVVNQLGNTLYFYFSSQATDANPVSRCRNSITIDISQFVANGGSFDSTIECTFSDGNGYLFVFHPSCDPFFCALVPQGISATRIPILIRDFVGLPETNPVTSRPGTLTNEHLYNLVNQGWVKGSQWQSNSSTSIPLNLGATVQIFITAGLGSLINNGDIVQGINRFPVINNTNTGFVSSQVLFTGTVQGYSSATGQLGVQLTNILSSVTGTNPGGGGGDGQGIWDIFPINKGYIDTWHSAEGNYPSNADVWWYFKDTSNNFNPTTTVPQVTVASSNAPQGHFIMEAFNMDRGAFIAVAGVTPVRTNVRPTNGTFFQGRVWYTGVNAVQPAQGDAGFYTWTENIYFSQVVQTSADFGLCYQQNDPTSENLFGLLPTDGGIITIPGSGPIYKLFPIQNGLIVFAGNGIWFITGSKGIGFAADDYVITQISYVQSISSTSFVNVLGLPFFWNEEGIYQVTPSQSGQLQVEPITVGTILTFFNEIPNSSKVFVRGAYNPIEYTIQWVYRSTDETGIVDRYRFDTVLNFNTFNKAFFPYTLSGTSGVNPFVCSILYVNYPNEVTSPDPGFKYLTQDPNNQFTFADEHDTSYVDWKSFDGIGVGFTSFFITGHKVRGQAQRRYQPQYINMWSRTNSETGGYNFQGLWDFANNTNSNRWTTIQKAFVADNNYDVSHRRFKLRGHGYSLQFKVSSIPGFPFDIVGWSVTDVINQGQ